MLNTSFGQWPAFSDEEVAAVAAVLKSGRVNFWTGRECREFEKEFAEWVGVKHAIALANGTVALELALRAMGIGPGDEVVVTPRSFIASVSCVVTVGATPVFADVDRDSQNLSAATIEAVLSPRTRAIIPVHLAGMPCDMGPIMELAEKHGLAVLEDCAQAHGARYRGQMVGSIAHIGAWSFCQDKIMTTGGEGGMVTTNDDRLWQTMWSLKDHGKSWQAVFERSHPPGFRWLHESFGGNARMLELQAAIGRIQLRRMSEWTATRRSYANKIWSVARTLKALRVPLVPAWAEHGAYKVYVFVRPDQLKEGWDRDRVMSEINRRDVPCLSGSCSEIYLEKAFDQTSFRPRTRLQVAEELGNTSLMFMVHPTITPAQIEAACDALREVMQLAAS